MKEWHEALIAVEAMPISNIRAVLRTDLDFMNIQILSLAGSTHIQVDNRWVPNPDLSPEIYEREARDLMDRIREIRRQAIGNQEYTSTARVTTATNFISNEVYVSPNQVMELFDNTKNTFNRLSHSEQERFRLEYDTLSSRVTIWWDTWYSLSEEEFVRQNETLLREIRELRERVARSGQ
jgi:hypothetical protein